MSTKLERTPDEIAAVLRYALGEFIGELRKHGFVAPIEVEVRDRNWTRLRTLRVEEGGRIAAERRRSKIFPVWPIKIVAVDRRRRVARVRIAADCRPGGVELLN